MGALLELVHDALTDRRKEKLDAEARVEADKRAAERAELDARAAALQAEITAKERQISQSERNARAEAMRTEIAKIEADRRARGKRELSGSELTRKAARRIAKGSK